MADAIGYTLSPHPRLDPIAEDVGTSMGRDGLTTHAIRWSIKYGHAIMKIRIVEA
jgi:hypothetical protein